MRRNRDVVPRMEALHPPSRLENSHGAESRLDAESVPWSFGAQSPHRANAESHGPGSSHKTHARPSTIPRYVLSVSQIIAVSRLWSDPNYR